MAKESVQGYKQQYKRDGKLPPPSAAGDTKKPPKNY